MPRATLLILKLLLLAGVAAGSMSALDSELIRTEHFYFQYPQLSWLRKVDGTTQFAFLGSSTISDAVDPTLMTTELGAPSGSVVNLAVPAHTFLQNYETWLSAREYLHSAKYVIVGYDPWLQTERFFATSYFLQLYWSPFERLEMLQHPIEHAERGEQPEQQILRDELAFRTERPALRTAAAAPIPEYFGGSPSKGAFLAALQPARELYEHFDRFPFSEMQFEKLRALKQSIEASGAKMILLITPKRSRWRASYLDTCADIDQAAEQLLSKYIGPTPTLNYSNFISDSLEATSFIDDLHLNHKGRDVFSRQLGKDLRSIATISATAPVPLVVR